MLRVVASLQMPICAVPSSSQVLAIVEQIAAHIVNKGKQPLDLPGSRMLLRHPHCANVQSSPYTRIAYSNSCCESSEAAIVLPGSRLLLLHLHCATVQPSAHSLL